jgi:tetratricopeptide (TPR) repeat protein
VAFNSATTWGLVERHLGNLDRVLGRYEAAEEKLRSAARRHETMGTPIWLARTRLDLARLLLERGGDSAHAADLLELACATARDLGCQSIEQQAGTLLDHAREPA